MLRAVRDALPSRRDLASQSTVSWLENLSAVREYQSAAYGTLDAVQAASTFVYSAPAKRRRPSGIVVSQQCRRIACAILRPANIGF
ncbi:hypothetical protein A6B35_33245 (plasmid) [Mesorhizobium amorphae CCNWGS0123]|nr:hypothetical protein A6B35_33245 [Mesorhizobium amorphae CCNWGS0123]